MMFVEHVNAYDIYVGDFVVEACPPTEDYGLSVLEVWRVESVECDGASMKFGTFKRCAYGDGVLSSGGFGPLWTGMGAVFAGS